MLVDDPIAMVVDPISAIMSGGVGTSRLEEGCYQTGHLGGSHIMPGYDQFPLVEPGPFGVCDSLQQLKDKCPELANPDRTFVVLLTEVVRENEPESGGWRWHKWGEYIGDHQIQHEHLKNEEGIDRVYVFHIYEKTSE